MRQAVFAAASCVVLTAAMLVLPTLAGACADRGVRLMPDGAVVRTKTWREVIPHDLQ